MPKHIELSQHDLRSFLLLSINALSRERPRKSCCRFFVAKGEGPGQFISHRRGGRLLTLDEAMLEQGVIGCLIKL